MSTPITLITGASSGLGASLARAYAAKGHRLCLLARNYDKLSKLQQELGGQVHIIQCDITNQAQVFAAVEKCIAELGVPDQVILNAGIASEVKLEPSFNLNETITLFNTNLFGVIYTIAALMPHLIKQRKGHIIAISSLAKFVSAPGNGAYAGSKAALFMFMESLRLQLKTYQIQVTTICPGFIKTPLTARNSFSMPFLMEKEVAIKKIMKAIEAKKAVYYFPKPLLWLIYLSKITPRFIVDLIMSRGSYLKTDLPKANWE